MLYIYARDTEIEHQRHRSGQSSDSFSQTASMRGGDRYDLWFPFADTGGNRHPKAVTLLYNLLNTLGEAR